MGWWGCFCWPKNYLPASRRTPSIANNQPPPTKKSSNPSWCDPTSVSLIHCSGTCKLDRNCTSTIKCTENADGTIVAEVCHSHYGHTKELEHSRLTKLQRQEIAVKLSQGVTRNKILNDIRDEVTICPIVFQLFLIFGIAHYPKSLGLNWLHSDNMEMSHQVFGRFASFLLNRSFFATSAKK